MRRVGWLVLWVAILQGCSFSQPRAPIRDAARHNHPVRHPVQPTVDHVIVQPGENLFRIAFEHGLDYRELAQWNGLSDPSKIRVGESLRLTPPPERPVSDKALPADKPATTSPPVPAPKPVSTPVQAAVSTVDTTEEAPSSWGWPAQGKVVTEFNENVGAKGIDIAGKRGSPVLATAPGRVIYAGAGLRGYGKLIIIKHSKILLSAYGHNDKVLVTEGQIVKLGQPIAEMGSTDADRVKLHFEIREYGKPVDPMTYLSGSPG
ncbi:MAG: peptidoglycan DD-metalloendopeptidase family protein [Parasulfuritortus sp.]|jgi:lipoprotein NlpD|nr:peptidoglycan DD-metalloendopeptidase family protein [Parasulfuritortus sp.]